MSEELGTPLYFKHVLTARGLVSRDFVYQKSKGESHVILWSRGQAGCEIYYDGERYVPETPGTLAALAARDAEIARLRGALRAIVQEARTISSDGSEYANGCVSQATWAGDRARRALAGEDET